MEGDDSMPLRMTAYLAHVAKTLTLALTEGLKPACAVIYLHKESYREDPGYFELDGELDLKVFVRYKVIKLWEEAPERILEMENPGLCPFLPLMAGNPDELLVKSLEKIKKTPETVASAETKRDLLAVLGALASKVIAKKDFLRKLLSELRIMGDNWFLDEIRDEGVQIGLIKGRELGREEGARQASLEGLWTVLATRFGEIPADLRRRIEAEATFGELRDLIRLAASCPSIQSFRSGLENGR